MKVVAIAPDSVALFKMEKKPGDAYYGPDQLDVGIISLPGITKCPAVNISDATLSEGSEVAIAGFPMGTTTLQAPGWLHQIGPTLQKGTISALLPFPCSTPHGLLIDLMIRRRAFRRRPHGAVGQPPESVRGRDDLVQSGAGKSLRTRRMRSQGGRRDHLPADIIGGFAGTAQVYQQSLEQRRCAGRGCPGRGLHRARRALRELRPPITIISTLPSAGVGAVLALILFEHRIHDHRADRRDPADRHRQEERDPDDRLRAESGTRARRDSRDAIYQAVLIRFRPIMMTTTAALLGALPLCFGLRRGQRIAPPLGISIVGGLIVSQALTLYTTPAVYLVLDRLRLRRGPAPALRAAE